MAWEQLCEYWDELSDGDMKVAQESAARQLQVTKAGQPAPPKPDAGTMAAVQAMEKLAVQMADRLGQLALIDPLVTKQTITGQKRRGQTDGFSVYDFSLLRFGTGKV